MNTLILKDERGAVETVPTSKGIATDGICPLLSQIYKYVETVPTSKGIATVQHLSLLLFPFLVETVPTSKGIATKSLLMKKMLSES